MDVGFTPRDAATGVVVATATEHVQVGVVSSATITPKKKLQTWSPQTPTTYALTARILADHGDEVNMTSVGVRVFDWNRKKAKLNGQEIELQGFSHHPSFAGMGAMTSPRLALFLAQVSKALGVNFWRNSHNPYEDAVYEMLSAVGVMNWDENRNFGSEQANQYHDMIKSHRHVVATMLYGLCNEGQCGVEEGAAAAAFMQVKNSLDPDRPQTANSVGVQDYNFSVGGRYAFCPSKSYFRFALQLQTKTTTPAPDRQTTRLRQPTAQDNIAFADNVVSNLYNNC